MCEWYNQAPILSSFFLSMAVFSKVVLHCWNRIILVLFVSLYLNFWKEKIKYKGESNY